MYAKVYGATIEGLEGVVVTVEVDISQGLPVFDIVGLPNQAVKESRERVRAAIKNSHFEFPMRRIVVNLGPAEIRKSSPGLDLPIAIGILAASGQIKLRKPKLQALLDKSMFIGEVLLDGKMKHTRGILSMAMIAKENNFLHLFTSADNLLLLKSLSTIEHYGCVSLESIIHIMENPAQYVETVIEECNVANVYKLDYSDVQGQELGKRAMVISAAGGHHVMMEGPPGAGKTMLAERLPTILPLMSEAESLETTRIHDIAGLLDSSSFMKTRPFRSPHHTSTITSIVGGGGKVKPGEITLAHNGVLFLDEAPEFNRSVLDALREPLESNRISIARYQGSYEYPAKMICVLAANPCPCGYDGDPYKPCICSSTDIIRYKHKLSGPILDRIDLFVTLERPTLDDMFQCSSESMSSSDMKLLVEQGRYMQEKRFKGLDFTLNGHMPHRALRELCQIRDTSWNLLGELYETFHFTGRAFDRLLKVGRTIADLEGSEYVETNHISEAMLYRRQ